MEPYKKQRMPNPAFGRVTTYTNSTIYPVIIRTKTGIKTEVQPGATARTTNADPFTHRRFLPDGRFQKL